MEEIDTRLIGKYIKSQRLSKQLSQAKLESMSNISTSSISNIESGSQGVCYNMSIPMVVKISHCLDISFDELLHLSGFLCAINDEKFKPERNQFYIANSELINLFYRLNIANQKIIIEQLRSLISSQDIVNQKNLNKKR